jgi:hypothetical protein
MTVNFKKSKILYFKKQSPLLCILPNEIMNIKRFETAKLLGITFNERMSFADHFDEVITKACQRLHILRILKRCLTKKQLWNVYFALIRTLLEYAAPIFMALPITISERIENVQRRAHKIICVNYKTGCNCITESLLKRRIKLGLKLHHGLHPTNVRLIMPHINSNRFRNTFYNYCTILKNRIFIE